MSRAGGRSVASILAVLSGMLLTLLTMLLVLSRVEHESLQLERHLERFSVDFLSMNSQGFSRFSAAIAMDKPLQHFYESRPERKLRHFRKEYRAARMRSVPRLRMLKVNKHFRRFRHTFLAVVNYRRSFWADRGTAVSTSEWVERNAQLDSEYYRQYTKFITKLRTINRRAYRGLIATLAVFAVAASLELLLIAGLGLAALDVVCRRIFGPNLFRFDTTLPNSHRDDDDPQQLDPLVHEYVYPPTTTGKVRRAVARLASSKRITPSFHHDDNDIPAHFLEMGRISRTQDNRNDPSHFTAATPIPPLSASLVV